MALPLHAHLAIAWQLVHQSDMRSVADVYKVGAVSVKGASHPESCMCIRGSNYLQCPTCGCATEGRVHLCTKQIIHALSEGAQMPVSASAH